VKKKNDVAIRSSAAEYLTYIAATGDDSQSFEMRYEDENIWLTQKMLATLYDVEVPTINEHIKKIFSDHELQEEATIRKFRIVQTEGSRQVNRETKHYNLQMIIAVGFKVNNERAVQFRKWANGIVKDYIIKGFAMDDERLKNGRFFGKDYFRELLERVRSIRASERRIYQQITDIFAECSIDYDPKSETTRLFYAHVQDKFHFAITGHTAAEIIALNADASKPLMGMSTYKNAPDGRVLKSDANVAKNYLSEADIKKLERAVSAFFDYIEGIIERRNTFTMESFAESVNKFLAFNEYRILEGFGTVSRQQAEQKAFAEYEKFNKQQRIESDFDREVKKLLQNKGAKE